MLRKHCLSVSLLALGLFSTAVALAPLSRAADAPPPPPKGNGGGQGGQGGAGDGGPGGGGGQGGGFHLIPPFAMDKLNLTDDQKKQLADLEADTKAKLEKILTADQLKAMQDARPPRRGGQGGQGGAPGGKDTAAGDAAGNGGPPAGGPPAGGPPAGGGQGGRPKR